MSSIEKRGERSWRLVVEAGYDSKGKRIKRYKTVKIDDEALLRTTKKLNDHLKLELSKFQIEIEAGEYIAPEKMTFASFVSEWRKKYAVKELHPTTLKQHNFHLDTYIIPVFGTKRLDQIKPIHILNFLTEAAEDGKRRDGKKGSLSPGTIELFHRVIRNIFERAVDWKIISTNPAKQIKPPKKREREMNVYDESDIEKLIEKLQDEPYHWRVMVMLAIGTGMRRGEMMALEWKHVDLDTGIIEVRQSFSMTQNGRAIITSPKTKKSVRKIALPDFLVIMLQEYKTYCDELKDNLADSWEGQDGKYFVFFNDVGKPFYTTRPSAWFNKFIKTNNLKHIRFHDLRHTSATLLIKQGVHAKIISERLGHSNINTTMNVYGHVMQSADREAANRLNVIFNPKTE